MVYPNETLACKYSCTECGLNRAIVQVPSRTDKINVTDWLQKVVMPAIALNHRARSPKCKSQACDLMIPINENCKLIGEPMKGKPTVE